MKKILKLSSHNCIIFHTVSGRLQFWASPEAVHYTTAAGHEGTTPGRNLKVYHLKINWTKGTVVVSGRGWEATIPAVDFVLSVYSGRRAYRDTKNWMDAIQACRKELTKEHIHFEEVS